MATKTFRGEGDLMVDALVAASQAAYANPNGGQPMPGFGRDLVPFFDDLGQEAGAANGAPAPAPAPQAQKKAKAPKSREARGAREEGDLSDSDGSLIEINPFESGNGSNGASIPMLRMHAD